MKTVELLLAWHRQIKSPGHAMRLPAAGALCHTLLTPRTQGGPIMRMPMFFCAGVLAFAAVTLVGGGSAPAYAGGSREGVASNHHLPDIEKKVITNEDLEAKYGKPSLASEVQSSQAISAAEQTAPAAAGTIARREPLSPEKDPRWYAQQVVSLNDEIARIDAETEPLIAFRAPGNTPGAGTGLIMNAPCQGITTDNRIAQLLSQRSDIEAQISDLEDTARRNGMPPGIFVHADEIVQASFQQPRLTPVQERAALKDRLGELSMDLTETQSVVVGMQDEMAARRMTLLPPTGDGGNLTTDLLQRLAARSNALQNEISSMEDTALSVGIPARDLP
jgi:hypothetical protein